MNKLKKIFLVGGKCYLDYLNWILPLGFKVTNNLEESDAVFFAGGSDVSPGLYGEETGSQISANPPRDEYEWDIFEKSKNKFKIGVCRGGQFLTVANGFKLIQHMQHPSFHDIITNNNEKFVASSSHHNQFLLEPNEMPEFSPVSKFELIAWSKKLSPFHLNGADKDYKFDKNYKEPEIVVFDGTEFGRGISLAIQMHPEWIDLNGPTVRFCQNLVMKFFKESEKLDELVSV